MNKTLTALVALMIGTSSTLAMAITDAPKPAKNPAVEQAIKECHAELGKPMPPKPTADKTAKADAKAKKGEFKKGEFKKGEHPKMSEADHKAMSECMSKKGFSKPEGMPFPPHGKPPVAPKAS